MTDCSRYLEDLGADDLDVIELTMAFEEEFGLELDSSIASSTIANTINVIAGKLAGVGRVEIPPCESTDRNTDDAAIQEVAPAQISQTVKSVRPLEIVLVMDTTGSMFTDAKIEGAKNAARQLLDTIYSGTLAEATENEDIRVALVPFAAAVRIDEHAFDFNLNWIDTEGLNPLSKLNFNDPSWNNYMAWGKLKSSASTNMSWNGCVEARAKGNQAEGTDYSLNDAAPVAEQPDTLFPAYFAPDTPSIGDVDGYADEFRRTLFTGSYIPEDSKEPNEITGLKKHQAQDFSHAGLEWRQKNQAKYDGRIIEAETVMASAGPWSGCAKSPIVPLTYSRANVDAGITAMSAAGSTLIAEGISWGFRVLSPSEPFTKVEGTSSIASQAISTFDHPRWRKVMVLVTDGDNDLSAGVDELNGTVYSAYGRGTEALIHNRFGSTSMSNKVAELDSAMTAACKKVKSAGIELYVTSFGSSMSDSTRSKLKACATDEDHYVHSASHPDLANFFNQIGQELLKK